MASKDDRTLVFSDLRGGMNTADPPLSLPPNQCVDAYNVDFWQSPVGRKRGGSEALTMTSGPSTGDFKGMGHFFNTGDAYDDELWVGTGVESPAAARTLYRLSLVSGYHWHSASAGADDYLYDFLTFNGKLFIACGSAGSGVTTTTNIRVWDGTSLRTAGLATPTTSNFSEADQGSGTYAATARWYKIAWTVQASGITVRRSELSGSETFTPSGSGASVRVTISSPPGNGETHWELYGAAAANGPYYLIATTAIGTTTYDDSTVPASYSSVTGTVPPDAGDYTPLPGASFLAADGNRLLFAHQFSDSTGTTRSMNRVWYSAVLGSSDIGDDERYPFGNYVDVGSNDNDTITGMCKEPLHGAIYVFKAHHIYKLTPTGLTGTPYAWALYSAGVGAYNNRSICVGQQANGDNAIYFASERGIYRIGDNGLENIGKAIESGLGLTSTYPSGMVYYAAKRQVWLYMNGYRWVYHVDTGGWARHTVDASGACLFPNYSNPSYDTLRPYRMYKPSTWVLYMDDEGTQDDTTSFQAYVKTAVRAPSGLLSKCTCEEPVIAAKAQSATRITVTATADYGLVTASGGVALTPKKAETRVVRKADGGGVGSCSTVQYQIGDAAASSQVWSLDAVVVPTFAGEPL